MTNLVGDLPDNVVAIETKWTDAAPVEVRGRWEGNACSHQHVTVDEVLRTVSCRDCGEERLDPLEVLIMLARTWKRWQREAAMLGRLNAEHEANELGKWERARDRHLGSHPDHAASFNAKIDAKGDPDRKYIGDGRSEFACDTCWSIYARHSHRWVVRRAPEPRSGQLQEPDA